MKNSAYHCHYDFIDNKVNVVYVFYRIRNFDASGTGHNYLFSSRMGKIHRGICFLDDEQTMRIYCADTGINMDFKNIPTNYSNSCQKYKWKAVCVVYDQTGKANASSLWVSHGNL